MNLLWGLFGIIVVLGISFLLSNGKRSINLRTIIGGLIIQVTFAFVVLKWNAGRVALAKFSDLVQNVIDYAGEGVGFLFGPLVDIEKIGFVFAFQVLTIIIFFSSLISVLYYLGIMQWVIKLIGGGLSKLFGNEQGRIRVSRGKHLRWTDRGATCHPTIFGKHDNI